LPPPLLPAKPAVVVLKKGMSAKLRALLGGSSSQASALSGLVVDETARLPPAAAAPSPRARDKAPVRGVAPAASPLALAAGPAVPGGGGGGGRQLGLSGLLAAAGDDARLQALRERSIREGADGGGGGEGAHSLSAAGSQHPALRRMLSKASVTGKTSGGLGRQASVASLQPPGGMGRSGSSGHHGSGGGPPPRAGAGWLGGRERTFSRTASVASMHGFGAPRGSGGTPRGNPAPRTTSVSGSDSVAWPPTRPVGSDASPKEATRASRASLSHV
jgi:hypothetical protein